ncbi:hypothetical protein AK830_g9027 [Neonectria ditissima]|uniref:Uncharacterized protein n=1 Tax=Neonectria ditissima TaxID=78410 RepID=A0A0P7AJ87_9HYPO|nr:hypothetical protein AK830_g9027 [Neonectria ditissima]
MAAQTPEPRIADDWLEVDSAASVVSLSTSDGDDYDDKDRKDDIDSHNESDLLVAPRPRSPLAKPTPSPSTSQPQPPPPCDDDDLYGRSETSSPVPRPASRASTTRLDQPLASLALDDHVKPASPSPLDQHTLTPHTNVDTNTATATATNTNFDIPDINDQENSNDPSFYHKSLCTVIDCIEATSAKALALGAARISTLSFLKSACDELVKHARDLEPILRTYAKRWEAKGSGMAAGEMPLNANLLEWMHHLRVQLLSAQTEMDRIRPRENNPDNPNSRLIAASIPLQVNVSLAGCAEALEDALATIETFMPIFKVDFDESQTKWMAMPVMPAKDVKQTQARTRSRQDPPHPNVSRIRRELYAMKDQVRRTSVFLDILRYATLPTPLPEAPLVIECLDRIAEGISIILTNHASEWIEPESALNSERVIPYHEFVALDPDVLHDITGHLEQLQDQLEVGEDETFNYSVEMIRNHQLVLLKECGHMDELTSIADLMQSLILSSA